LVWHVGAHAEIAHGKREGRDAFGWIDVHWKGGWHDIRPTRCNLSRTSRLPRTEMSQREIRPSKNSQVLAKNMTFALYQKAPALYHFPLPLSTKTFQRAIIGFLRVSVIFGCPRRFWQETPIYAYFPVPFRPKQHTHTVKTITKTSRNRLNCPPLLTAISL